MQLCRLQLYRFPSFSFSLFFFHLPPMSQFIESFFIHLSHFSPLRPALALPLPPAPPCPCVKNKHRMSNFPNKQQQQQQQQQHKNSSACLGKCVALHQAASALAGSHIMRVAGGFAGTSNGSLSCTEAGVRYAVFPTVEDAEVMRFWWWTGAAWWSSLTLEGLVGWLLIVDQRAQVPSQTKCARARNKTYKACEKVPLEVLLAWWTKQKKNIPPFDEV